MKREIYLGNENLKSRNVNIKWDDNLVKEWIKCKEDPIYFAEKYIKIVNVDKGFVQIKLYDYQKDIINSVSKNRYTIVNASRQCGKSVTAVCIILHYILFNDHKTVALLANKGPAAREILNRIQLAYEALPKWIQQGILVWNKGSITLENGCVVIAEATSSSSIRGKSISLLYIDETAHVKNWDEFFASVFPTISSGKTTKILYTSTPNGLNHFYKIWDLAGKKETDPKYWNGFHRFFIPWQRVPGRDEKWKESELAAMNWDYAKFNQEFACEFIGSSGTLISGDKLKNLTWKVPLVEDPFGITQYFLPEENHIYVQIVDVSRGKGLDYSAFSIIDVTKEPYQQVMVFRSNLLNVTDYTEIIYRFGKLYNDASILVEINDIGGQVADMLFEEYEYENILYTGNKGRSGKKLSAGDNKNEDRGIRTTKSVKSIGCSMLKVLIEQDKLIINDFNTLEELNTFSKKKFSYEAESGCHDDLVMGLVLFSWLTDQLYFKDLTGFDMIKRLREKTNAEMEDQFAPFGFSSVEEDEIDDQSNYISEASW